jgi:hypothetical protein
MAVFTGALAKGMITALGGFECGCLRSLVLVLVAVVVDVFFFGTGEAFLETQSKKKDGVTR